MKKSYLHIIYVALITAAGWAGYILRGEQERKVGQLTAMMELRWSFEGLRSAIGKMERQQTIENAKTSLGISVASCIMAIDDNIKEAPETVRKKAEEIVKKNSHMGEPGSISAEELATFKTQESQPH